MFSQPGAMRCGFGLYRAFQRDSDENKNWVKKHGTCKVPSLCLSGEKGRHAAFAETMASEVFDIPAVNTVKDASHYVAEENPEDFVRIVVEFVDKYVNL